MNSKARLKKVSLNVVVNRADGSVDDFGEVMNSGWGPIRRWFARRRIERLNRKHRERLEQ